MNDGIRALQKRELDELFTTSRNLLHIAYLNNPDPGENTRDFWTIRHILARQVQLIDELIVTGSWYPKDRLRLNYISPLGSQPKPSQWISLTRSQAVQLSKTLYSQAEQLSWEIYNKECFYHNNEPYFIQLNNLVQQLALLAKYIPSMNEDGVFYVIEIWVIISSTICVKPSLR